MHQKELMSRPGRGRLLSFAVGFVLASTGWMMFDLPTVPPQPQLSAQPVPGLLDDNLIPTAVAAVRASSSPERPLIKARSADGNWPVADPEGAVWVTDPNDPDPWSNTPQVAASAEGTAPGPLVDLPVPTPSAQPAEIGPPEEMPEPVSDDFAGFGLEPGNPEPGWSDVAQ